MKPLAAPVIIASKEHHLPQHYNIMSRGDEDDNGSASPADPHCFLRGVNVGLKAFYPYQQSIHQSALYQILLFCGRSPLSLSDSEGALSHAPALVKGAGSGVTPTQNQYQCQQEENCLCH